MSSTRDEDSYRVQGYMPCDDCGSSDAVSLYSDNRTHCFSCSKTRFNVNADVTTTTTIRRSKGMLLEMEVGGEYIDLRGTDPFIDRGIIKSAAEKYGVKVKRNAEGDVSQVIFPYCNLEGEYKAQKIRKKGLENKGLWFGSPAEAKTFFGQHLFNNGRKIIVTEGEYDCVAVYQMFGQKYPVISLRSGADKLGTSPVNEFKANFEYFRNFGEVILCFDADEPGIVSATKVAQLFPANKCKIMKMYKHKDANEYLKAGHAEDFTKEFWNAKPLSPQGIVFGTDLGDRIITKLRDRQGSTAVKYPWEGLNKLTYGIRKEEMVTIISGTGSGKSAMIGELMYHILMNTNEKLGVMMLEESVEMANLRIASLHANKPYHLPDTDWTEEELRGVLKATVESVDEEGNPRVVSFDHFGSNGIDETLFRIDHMVALGCKYLFLDHISILVSDQANGDERRALDEIATKLRMKVQEHNVSLFIVSHLRRTNSKPHEEGGQTSLADIRGTQAIAQLSDIVIGLERNGQSEDEVERNTTTIRVLKNRFCGFGGVAAKLFYDKATGRLMEVPEEVVEITATEESKTPVDWTTGDEMPF